MLIYDWGTQPGYLAFHLWPAAHRLPGSPHDTSPDLIAILAKCLAPEEPVLLHICLSHLSGWHTRIAGAISWLEDNRHPVGNAVLRDVSKRRLQALNAELGLPTTLLDHGAHCNTKVIIKSNRNYAGTSERRLSRLQRRILGISDRDPRIVRFDEYEICNLKNVSPRDLADQQLVVERFIENNDNRIFRFYRNGTRQVLTEAFNPDPIKKMKLGLRRVNYLIDDSNATVINGLLRIQRNCLRFCNSLGLDFGTLDVVTDENDVPYIIDANPTPGWGEEVQLGMLEHLSLSPDAFKRWGRKLYERSDRQP